MKIVRVRIGKEDFFATLEGETLKRLAGEPFEGIAYNGEEYALKGAQLLAPVRPSKIVAVGKNYSDHAKEMGSDAPEEPLLFLKPSTSVIGPEDEIVTPPDCARLDYEAELAVVIGRRAKDVPMGGYKDVVLGYTCLNDVTARDLQAKDGQWTRAKGYDTFCPIGPWIETELDPNNLKLVARLNGKDVQDATTAMMIHNVDKLVYYASRVMTLLPGDIIATGTPAGIGPMQKGDVIEVEVEGIGTLKNTVCKD